MSRLTRQEVNTQYAFIVEQLKLLVHVAFLINQNESPSSLPPPPTPQKENTTKRRNCCLLAIHLFTGNMYSDFSYLADVLFLNEVAFAT